MRTQNYLSVGQISSCEVFSPSFCFRPLKHLWLLNVFLQYKVLCSHKLDPLAHSGLQFPPYKLHFSNLFIPQRFFFLHIQRISMSVTNSNVCNWNSISAGTDLPLNKCVAPSLSAVCVCVCVCVFDEVRSDRVGSISDSPCTSELVCAADGPMQQQQRGEGSM